MQLHPLSQAMAIPAAILGKGIRGDLCQQCVLVTRISGGSWGAACLGKQGLSRKHLALRGLGSERNQ